MSLFTKSANTSVRVSHLSPDELADLHRLESTIKEFVATYSRVGMALRSIRDRQLYRSHYESFDAYCQAKWDFTPQHAGRLIAAAGVASNLEPSGFIPQTERQARPLAALEPAEQLDAWSEVLEMADGEPITTGQVEKAVAKRSPKKKKKKATAKPITLKVPGARIVITPGKAFTSPDQALRDALAKFANQARAA